nr:AAA family ATPase [Plastoroseomonas hellenica]
MNSLEVANFRKFRDPLKLSDFSPGLNVIVEPNERGKSTLLEALRAAFFIRYSAKHELVRSFMPHGDDVAPRIAVEFAAGGKSWMLQKQFLRAPFVRLTGPDGRRESEAAEEALQELLGFERGNNRGTDPETRGPLGMLWVEQASALAVETPNRIVRDSVRSILEAEVGAVTGGKRFDAIRNSVETSYANLRTARTGQSRGELAAAEARLAAASDARQAAETTLRGYEHSLTELEQARARLRIIERDLADPEAAELRRKLEEDVKAGQAVQLRLSIAEAEHGRAVEIEKAAAGRVEALQQAESRAAAAAEQEREKRAAYESAKAAADGASKEERTLRAALDARSADRETREVAVAAARARATAFARSISTCRARDSRTALTELEKQERELRIEADGQIQQGDLDGLAAREKAVVEARARFEAGAVRIDVELADGVSLRVDGELSEVRRFDALSVTRFAIGDAGSFVVRPPAGVGRSIEAELAAAETQLAAKLRELAVSSHAQALTRSERARAAARQLQAVRRQIAAACPGDPTIGLAPGAEALRAFTAALADDDAVPLMPDDDIGALEAGVSSARAEEAAAMGRQDESRGALSKAEAKLAAAAADHASSVKEEQTAVFNLRAVRSAGEKAKLEEVLAEAQSSRTKKFEALGAARDAAKNLQVEAIQRRLTNLKRAADKAAEERLELVRQIGSLEATVSREGAIGPAGVAKEAIEEEAAARDAHERLRREADVLGMLRGALNDAAAQASRTFLAPVSKRAARYVERLLPGCALTFDDELGLTSIGRAGTDEACGGLSRGTQEQLAILTRLAFADLLLEDGAPVSLILDDPLVYSDDVRLEAMTDIVLEASERMQVLLLTCRSKAFRHLDANRIVL